MGKEILKFSKDVYSMSFEDFEKFAKSKFPKAAKKQIKEAYERNK